MKKLFLNTNELDLRATLKFGLESEILMENAALSIANHIRKKIKKGSKILGICGGGNNAADVFAALRMLQGDYKTKIFLASSSLKPLAKKQLEIAKKAGVKLTTKIKKSKCIVDGLFGSGLNRELSKEHKKLLKKINKIKAYKVACDIPSGLSENGNILGECFKADTTICMGALKLGCFLDEAKDYVGRVKVANLGICKDKFQTKTDTFLLQKRDLKLPFRKKLCVNKGDFGHAFVVCGKLSGASEICAKAAFSIGAGLVSVIGRNKIIKNYLMQTDKISQKMNAGAIGMGLSIEDVSSLNLNTLMDKSLVLDAMMCHCKATFDILKQNKKVVLTPHPKEFCSLLKLGGLADISVDELQKNRFEYAKKFSLKFKCVLVLKGANTIIAKNGKLFIMPFGSSSLAKGGSGDVLSGIILGLLAQGYSPLKAAINGALAHALSAKKQKINNYALNPNNIIKGIKCLQKK
ncbi:bifunctional ADP-dependent NAD(P)H-hydrate dehydratase/NAD(P)H-hydrate epimerase [Campylobacter pinnipediorum]|uniref:bifunctional ADP-dependent NAD(P)H-hydrate dehydratase/NAD(P)H-hydrate epimerase n=1 Tax=Campylobacter pinnipediorum TaxID=1965231 RepID=UPI00084D624C|nr:bifunctional ADP-dependent NAD(P)H-hydrate dehydratase/NAD(P)H-hydrate epimerase [Campylobacter pinnipediorum]